MSFYSMAFSRMAICSDRQTKSFIQVSIVVTAGLGGIVITSSFDQADHHNMHGCQDPPRSANRHASSIFAESNITAIVQASFDQPMFAPGLEHFGRGSLVSGKAGNAELDFTACFVDFSLTEPEKLAFEAINLSNPGPVEVVIQHSAGLDGSFFEPSMAVIGLAGRQKISLDLAKTGFRPVGGKQALNVFIQPGLVLFDRVADDGHK